MRVIKCRHCNNETKMDLRANYKQDLSDIEIDDFGVKHLAFLPKKIGKFMNAQYVKE